MSTEIIWTPSLPPGVIAVFAVIGAALIVAQVLRAGMRGVLPRTVLIGALVIALMDPRISVEERTPEADIALIVVDETTSQGVADRPDQTQAAVDQLTEDIAKLGDVEVRTVRVADGDEDLNGDGTRMINALSDALADVPRSRFAGAVLVTDGQIHDADLIDSIPGPIHVALSGNKDEKDRRVVVSDAPGYGIVGNDVTVRFSIEDKVTGSGFSTDLVDVNVRVDGVVTDTLKLATNKEHEHTITLDHAGATFIELEAEVADGELSPVNNRAVVSVNGVRDRLRVLLVSGQPHAGERAWRNLLKSDPSVDLVHFTILRPPEKNDFTPLNEISLIAFPVRELFEEKIDEFDLIVFDRYMVRDVLPPSYFRNISDYVRDGGALLLSVGPEFAGLRSLSRTPLADVLPAVPNGRVLEQRFKPRISEIGHRHPVTSGLPGGVVPGRDDLEPTWGSWFRQIDVTTSVAPSLLDGVDGSPLLVAERVDEGRVGLVASDQLWLWSRGFEGGGPQAELMRRVAHWLMKEPELDEEGLSATIDRGELRIERRSLAPGGGMVVVESPTGVRETIQLKLEGPGRSVARLPADEIGLYRIEDGSHLALAPSGALNPLELADLRATDEVAQIITAATGGGLNWIVDGVPAIRSVQPDRQTSGSGWIGLTRNGAYSVTGVSSVPLAPRWLVIFIGLSMAALAWWREGR